MTVATAAHWLGPLANAASRRCRSSRRRRSSTLRAARPLRSGGGYSGDGATASVVRIGGADLFAALGARRPAARTVYDSVLGPTVCARWRRCSCRAGSRDGASVGHRAVAGRCARWRWTSRRARSAKTAIHPQQVPVIDLPGLPGVARGARGSRAVLAAGRQCSLSRRAMCERAPHARGGRRRWWHGRPGVAGERADQRGRDAQQGSAERFRSRHARPSDRTAQLLAPRSAEPATRWPSLPSPRRRRRGGPPGSSTSHAMTPERRDARNDTPPRRSGIGRECVSLGVSPSLSTPPGRGRNCCELGRQEKGKRNSMRPRTGIESRWESRPEAGLAIGLRNPARSRAPLRGVVVSAS